MFKRLLIFATLWCCETVNAALLTDFTGSFALYERITEQLADFDADGRIKGEDFLRWQRGFGSAGDAGAMSEFGDANADGSITRTDFRAWMNQFGTGGPNEIPESVCFKLFFDPPGVISGQLTVVVDAPLTSPSQQRFGFGRDNDFASEHPGYSVFQIGDPIITRANGRERYTVRVGFLSFDAQNPPQGAITIFGRQIVDLQPQLGLEGVQVGFDFQPSDSITIRDASNAVVTFNDTQLPDVSLNLVAPVILEVNTITGAMNLRAGPEEFAFDSYLITSFSNALNPGGWISIADSQIFPGWQEVTASTSMLQEFTLQETTILQPHESLDLGQAFNPSALFRHLRLDWNNDGAFGEGVVVYLNNAPGVAVPEPSALALAATCLIVAWATGGRLKIGRV